MRDVVWTSLVISESKQPQATDLRQTAPVAPPSPPSRPPIVVRECDLAGLAAAAFDGLMDAPREAGALLQEIERATVVTETHEWSRVVVPGSLVLYREGLVDPPRWTRLVMPEDADGTGTTLSVLSLVGAGLLGLAVGQAISWEDRVGGRRRLEVINVNHPENEVSL